MTKLICITGIDGSGKSTLVRALHEHISGSVVANIWQSFEANQQLFKTRREVYEYMMSLPVNARVLFLAHAIRYGLEKALEKDASMILIDGYYYKYFAPELVLGADPDFVEKLSATFPQPQTIICLDADAQLSFARKQEITPYECGFASAVNEENYTRFQSQVIKKRELFDQKKWHFLDARLSPRELQEKALDLCLS